MFKYNKIKILLILLVSNFNIFSNNLFEPSLQKIKRSLCSSPLTQVPGSPYIGTGMSPGISYSPNGNFLAVANGPSVDMFSVNPNGSLSFIMTEPFPLAAQLSDLVFFPNGNFLAVADPNGGGVSTAIVNPNGTISFLNFTSISGSALAISQNSEFAASVVGPFVNYMTVDASNGDIKLVGTQVGIGSLVDVQYFLNSQFLAVVNEGNNSVDIYSVTPVTGQPIFSSSTSTQSLPSRISISSDSKFAAVTNGNSNTVTIFSINPVNGAFTPLTGSLATSSFATGPNPLGVAYSPDYTSLTVANSGDNTISVYNINPNNTLSFITTYPVVFSPNPPNPDGVAYSPNSAFIAITNPPGNGISVFSVNLQANNISGTTNCNQSIEIAKNSCGGPDPIVITAVSNPSNGTSSFSTNSVTYIPNQDFVGSDSFTYTVTDNIGRTASGLVSIEVSPIAANINVTTLENTPVDINVFLKSCGNNLSVEQPSNGSAQINGSLIIYTPNKNFFGIDSFNYTLSDGINIVTGTITVTVTEVPNPPTPPLPPLPIRPASDIVKAIIRKYCPFLII